MQFIDQTKPHAGRPQPDGIRHDLTEEEFNLMDSLIADPRVLSATSKLSHLIALGLVCTDATTHVTSATPLAKAWRTRDS